MHIAETALMDVALGSASPEDATAVQQHLAGCAECSSLLRNFQTAVGQMREAAVTREVVGRAWERTAPLISGPTRFDGFAPEIASWLDFAEQDARGLLRTLDDDAQLNIDLAPGVRAREVKAGLARAGCQVIFVHAKPGAVMPEHLHEGAEHAFIVQGAYRTDDGRGELMRGECATYAKGTKHTVTALEGVDCYCFVIHEPA